MSEITLDDFERQEDEILAISSIYDYNEFSYSKEDIVRCSFNIFLDINDGELRLKNVYNYDQTLTLVNSTKKHSVKYLPPVRLYVSLPYNYPSKNPPIYSLTISWLPPWEISFVCQKLDEIWQDNEGNEVLFLWLDFLKNDLFSFLCIQDTLDISFMYMIYNNPMEYIRWNLIMLIDDRAANRALFLNPLQFLLGFDKDQSKVVFERKYHECRICFEEYIGVKCIQFDDCSHTFCRECIRQYIALKIDTNAVKDILCPDSDCSFVITRNVIKDVCADVYSKYEKLTLQIMLSTMDDIVFCPRNSCQCPVIKETDDTLAICSNCHYSFCSYCFKVYHGVEPCAMTSVSMTKLIDEYQKGDNRQKKILEKKYGKKQIQIVVEKHLTEEYLKTNAKSCPNCQTLVTKIDGCNKMICIHCQASFCWLCGKHITMANAYDHFVRNGGTCYGRLFEGVHEENLDGIGNVDIIENMLWFNEQLNVDAFAQ